MTAPRKPQESAPATAGTESAPEVLRRVERLLDARFADARFATTREDLTPLLEDLHVGLSALFPAPGGVRVPPEEQQALRAKFVGTVDTLEDVLEAIDRADRAGRARGPRAREGR